MRHVQYWCHLSQYVMRTILVNLRKLEFSRVPLLVFPKSFANLRSLQYLCVYQDTLATVPDCLHSHGSLHTLDLSSKAITRLPNDLFSSLSSLCKLDLAHCPQLTELPHGVCNLSRLQHLNLACCSRLTSLPQDFGSLNNLTTLNLAGLGMLIQLPDSFCSLSRLQILDLCYCDRLKSLPDSFGNLSRLHSLRLNGCCQLAHLPTSFSSLVSLEVLDLWYCDSLHSLPAGFIRPIHMSGDPMCVHGEDRDPTAGFQRELDMSIGLALLDL